MSSKESIMKEKVCVFGSFNVDIVARVDRFPLPGESLIANSSMTSAGGKGANQAVAALKSGANVHYIGKIGEDAFGPFAREYLKSVGFDALTLLSTDKRPSGNALIFVAEGEGDAENMISVDPGANMTITDEEIARCVPSIECADVLLVQLENNISAIEQVISIGRRNNALVILNPAPWQPIDNAILKKVDLVTPNATEAQFMTGVEVTDYDSAGKAATLLHERGCQSVIITMGSQGALLSEAGVKTIIPLFPSQPKDTTGAGDAFNGALAAKLANGESTADAARFASAYASVSVECLGAAPQIDIADVEKRLLTLEPEMV